MRWKGRPGITAGVIQVALASRAAIARDVAHSGVVSRAPGKRRCRGDQINSGRVEAIERNLRKRKGVKSLLSTYSSTIPNVDQQTASKGFGGVAMATLRRVFGSLMGLGEDS
jgi:hypothetical protein